MRRVLIFLVTIILIISCKETTKKTEMNNSNKDITAKDILGNPEYTAISYGGYRAVSRDVQPTIPELKEDMRILEAMDIKFLRTYNVHLAQASNLLKAISELKNEDPNFEMYVMLGAWIDCKNAFTDMEPDHNQESERNAVEIETAAKLAKQYPDIVKVLAVGNEAMVRWATSYYVQPSVILKYVNQLQDLKKKGELPKDLWITSSDDYLSWGGGDPTYHTADLAALVRAVDYVSMHTYAMHNSFYNPQFWNTPVEDKNLSDKEKVDNAMLRAIDFAKNQYKNVSSYVKAIDSTKTVHIGESGWTTLANENYGEDGSRAADEFKAGTYYKLMREWTKKENISLFYFEAFDEQWKDAKNPLGSENHFGLINLKGEAKYAIWDLVDNNTFEGLTRNGQTISKTYNGNLETLNSEVLTPPQK